MAGLWCHLIGLVCLVGIVVESGSPVVVFGCPVLVSGWPLVLMWLLVHVCLLWSESAGIKHGHLNLLYRYNDKIRPFNNARHWSEKINIFTDLAWLPCGDLRVI